jgi:glycogen debranching enzyme
VNIAAPTDSYLIPATASTQETRPRTLKHGDTFAVLDRNGNMTPGGSGTQGLYHRDTRYLSLFVLLLEGCRPMLLSSTLRDDSATLTSDLTNPDLFEGGRLVMDHDQLHIRRSTYLWQATLRERILVRSFADVARTVTLDLHFAADFADLFEVRGTARGQRGRHHPPALAMDGVVFAYTGLDQRRRTTTIRFDPAPTRLEGARAQFSMDLPPGGRGVFFLEIACNLASPPERPVVKEYVDCLQESRRALRRSAGRAASINTSNEIFNEAVRRAVSDLTMLVTDTPEGPFPYAGIPWFSAAFGRDALLTALMVLWMDPAIARGVLLHLAANQAQTVNPAADAEPGKILHEVRYGEMAELGEVPFRRYYGSVDSTPLFVMLAGAYLERTADLVTLRRLWPHIVAALDWMDQYGDRDGDGFIEYFRMGGNGLANQGWKDSHDSVFHADGSMATGPIALVEVQGYAYAARLAAARMARALGEPGRATGLEAQAARLRQGIEASFWCEDLGTYALALDGEKRPCRVRTSNAGHLLMCGVPSTERAAVLAATLMDAAGFSGWGVRTVAMGEPRYNPISYHNGSVWPHDNALIGMGMARYGFRIEAARILQALFDASAHIDLRRLPELFCGFSRRRGQGPTFYPVACSPQAWAAVAPLGLLAACLGIAFDPAARAVRFDDPVLPAFAERVILRNLAIGDARIDVRLQGAGPMAGMQVLSRTGDIKAVMVG